MRRPSPHRQQVDLETVQADEALLDALGQGGSVPDDDELAAMLGAWRANLDTEPLPALSYEALPLVTDDADAGWAGGPDGQTQVIPMVDSGRSRRSRRSVPLRPRTVRLAVAAAVVIATAGGVSVAAAGAQPSDPLWPVVKIVHPGVADMRAAQDAIDKARDAVDDRRYDDARELIDKAAALVAKVHDPQQAQRLRDELDEVRGMLAAAVPSTGPTPRSPRNSTPTPSPTVSTGAGPGGASPSPSTSPSTGHGLLPPLLPSLPPLLPSLLPHL
ncbi:MAG TPA: anti-sigma-D factor RsdA [Rugosimonospora sp.]